MLQLNNILFGGFVSHLHPTGKNFFGRLTGSIPLVVGVHAPEETGAKERKSGATTGEQKGTEKAVVTVRNDRRGLIKRVAIAVEGDPFTDTRGALIRWKRWFHGHEN